MNNSLGKKSEENCKLPDYHTKDLLFDLLNGKGDIIRAQLKGNVSPDGISAHVDVTYNKDRLNYHIIITPVCPCGNKNK